MVALFYFGRQSKATAVKDEQAVSVRNVSITWQFFDFILQSNALARPQAKRPYPLTDTRLIRPRRANDAALIGIFLMPLKGNRLVLVVAQRDLHLAAFSCTGRADLSNMQRSRHIER